MTSFIDIIEELANSASDLLEETNLAFKCNRISEEEYTGYTNLYDELDNLISEFNIGETSPNAFLRNLYDLTKMYEHLGDSIYSNSMYDLLADTYIELVTINLHRKVE